MAAIADQSGPDPDMPSDPRPQPPEAPLPTDCCGGGCAVCVYDMHAEQQAAYLEALAAWRARHPGRD